MYIFHIIPSYCNLTNLTIMINDGGSRNNNDTFVFFLSHEAPSRNSSGVSSANEPERLAAACGQAIDTTSIY